MIQAKASFIEWQKRYSVNYNDEHMKEFPYMMGEIANILHNILEN